MFIFVLTSTQCQCEGASTLVTNVETAKIKLGEFAVISEENIHPIESMSQISINAKALN